MCTLGNWIRFDRVLCRVAEKWEEGKERVTPAALLELEPSGSSPTRNGPLATELIKVIAEVIHEPVSTRIALIPVRCVLLLACSLVNRFGPAWPAKDSIPMFRPILRISSSSINISFV